MISFFISNSHLSLIACEGDCVFFSVFSTSFFFTGGGGGGVERGEAGQGLMIRACLCTSHEHLPL